MSNEHLLDFLSIVVEEIKRSDLLGPSRCCSMVEEGPGRRIKWLEAANAFSVVTRGLESCAYPTGPECLGPWE